MSQTHRFGRRLPLPSTRQIKHELRLFCAQEEARLKARNGELDGGEEASVASAGALAEAAVPEGGVDHPAAGRRTELRLVSDR